MKINYYKSYIDAIKWSVWSQAYRHFWINKWWKDIDILQDGNLSCAYYVSNLLKQFNLIKAWSANTKSTISMLLEKWRYEIDNQTNANDIPIWSVIVRQWWYGNDGLHSHIWFFVWDENVISNDSYQQDRSGMDYEEPQYCPIVHHYNYRWTRKIDKIYTYDRENSIDRLYHYELDVKIYGQTLSDISWYSFSEEDYKRSIWSEDGLEYSRICGICNIASAINYYKWIDIYTEKVFSDLISYRNNNYQFVNPNSWNIETRKICNENNDRSHWGLIDIAQRYNIWWEVIQNNMSDMDTSQIISMIYDNINKNTITILSVDKYIWQNYQWWKWWHLVSVVWIDYNGYEHSLMIINPLYPQNLQKVPVIRFLQWFAGKWILLYNL